MPNTQLLPQPADSRLGYVQEHGEIPRVFTSSLVDEPTGISYYLRTFRKHASVILSCAAISTTIAILYCIFTPPLFTAETILELKGYAPVLANIQSETLFGNDTRRIEYQKTTVAKLKLAGLADEVLAHDKLAEDLQEYWESRRTPLSALATRVASAFTSPHPAATVRSSDPLFTIKPSIINRYLDLIEINPVHETNLVGIQVTTAQPELSQRLANAHATGFINHLQKERQESITANLSLLQHQATDLKARVTAAEQELSAYAAKNKLYGVSDDGAKAVTTRQIESLSSLLAEATGRRIKTESLLSEVGARKPDELSVTDDELVKQLRSTLQQAESEYATLGSRVTAAYPAMVELKAKITAVKKAIQDERKRSLRLFETQLANEKQAEEKLRRHIDEEKALAQDTSQRLIQYNILAKEANSLRDLYQAVLKQAKEVEVSAASVASHVFVTDYATKPTSPSAPKTQLLVTLFVILGVAIGLVVALILEAFDNTIKSTDDVRVSLDLPVLGAVPRFEDSTSLGTQPTLPRLPSSSMDPAPPADVEDNEVAKRIVSLSSPQDVVSEALRTIRAGILLSSADHPPRVIMLTSAMKGEGKTTVLFNLAATLAQASHRTLMIDGDLRERGLSRIFCKDTGPGGLGLTNYLTGQTQLDQVIKPTPVEGLDILPAGSKAPNPAELLSSSAMTDLIETLSSEYDFIVLDSPPILPVADGLTLSRVVDSVVLVVRSQITDREMAQESRRRLLRVKARLLGVVLNDLDPRLDPRDTLMYGGYTTSDESIIT
jgi:capsular exopolysaccharide synthesis family protein